MMQLAVNMLWQGFCFMMQIGMGFVVFGWVIKGFFALIK